MCTDPLHMHGPVTSETPLLKQMDCITTTQSTAIRVSNAVVMSVSNICDDFQHGTRLPG